MKLHTPIVGGSLHVALNGSSGFGTHLLPTSSHRARTRRAMGRSSSYDLKGNVRPLAALLKPHMTKKHWISYLKDRREPVKKDQLQAQIAIPKSLQTLHGGLSFKFNDLVQAIKFNNWELNLAPPEDEEIWAEVCALMLQCICRHAMQGPLRPKKTSSKKDAGEIHAGADAELAVGMDDDVEGAQDEGDDLEDGEDEDDEEEEDDGYTDAFARFQIEMDHLETFADSDEEAEQELD